MLSEPAVQGNGGVHRAEASIHWITQEKNNLIRIGNAGAKTAGTVIPVPEAPRQQIGLGANEGGVKGPFVVGERFGISRIEPMKIQGKSAKGRSLDDSHVDQLDIDQLHRLLTAGRGSGG